MSSEKKSTLDEDIAKKAKELNVDPKELMDRYMKFQENMRGDLNSQMKEEQVLTPLLDGDGVYEEVEIDIHKLDYDREYVTNNHSLYYSLNKVVSKKLDIIVAMCCRIAYAYGLLMSRLQVKTEPNGEPVKEEAYKIACEVELRKVTAAIEKMTLFISQSYSMMHGARKAYEKADSLKIKNLIKFTYKMLALVFVGITDNEKKWGTHLTHAPKHDIIFKKMDIEKSGDVKIWNDAFQMAVQVICVCYHIDIWLMTIAQIPGMKDTVANYRETYFNPIMKPFMKDGESTEKQESAFHLESPVVKSVINMSNDIIDSMFTRKEMPDENDAKFMDVIKEEFLIYNDRRKAAAMVSQNMNMVMGSISSDIDIEFQKKVTITDEKK